MAFLIMLATIISIFGFAQSALNCEYVKNIEYNAESYTHIIGVYPLNKCIAFYQLSDNNIESEMYFCENNVVKVNVWNASSECGPDDPNYTVDVIQADEFNCGGGECANLQSSTTDFRQTDSNVTCPTSQGPNDLMSTSYSIINECFAYNDGSAIESCDSNSGITGFYQFNNTNCVDDGTKELVWSNANNGNTQCFNYAQFGYPGVCSCGETPSCGSSVPNPNPAPSPTVSPVTSDPSSSPSTAPTTPSPSRSPLRNGETHAPTTKVPTRSPVTVAPSTPPSTAPIIVSVQDQGGKAIIHPNSVLGHFVLLIFVTYFAL